MSTTPPPSGKTSSRLAAYLKTSTKLERIYSHPCAGDSWNAHESSRRTCIAHDALQNTNYKFSFDYTRPPGPAVPMLRSAVDTGRAY